MQFWEKIMQDVEDSANQVSEKAGEWFKIGAEKVKEGAGVVSDKAKVLSQFAKLKWTQRDLQNKIHEKFVELGDHIYNEIKQDNQLETQGPVSIKVDQISQLEAELKEIDAQVADASESLSHQNYRDMEKDLEEGGVSVKQVIIPSESVICGKKIKEVTLPAEVLIGTIVRNNEVIIPKGETEIREGDKVTILGKKEEVESALSSLTTGM